MSEQMAAQMYAELLEIRSILARLQAQVEQLVQDFDVERSQSDAYTLTSIIGLGESGFTDVSERHDYYVGEAIAQEHLR